MKCTCENNGDYCETCNALIEAAEESGDSIEQVYLQAERRSKLVRGQQALPNTSNIRDYIRSSKNYER